MASRKIRNQDISGAKLYVQIQELDDKLSEGYKSYAMFCIKRDACILEAERQRIINVQDSDKLRDLKQKMAKKYNHQVY